MYEKISLDDTQAEQISNMAACRCSGIRSCLLCEGEKGDECLKQTAENTNGKLVSLSFCISCQKPFSGISCSHDATMVTMKNGAVNMSEILTGVSVIEHFVSMEEEQIIVSEIEKFPWKISQSGRKKQDFGPKVNFKKKKLQLGRFSGLPGYSQFFIERMQKTVPQLANFHPIELCNLDYCPDRGASIDPHLDDSWLWGEHLVTLNLLSETILSLTDLKCIYEVNVPLPRYSLVILKGESRYKWLHGIKRSAIKSRRIGITLRELSEEFTTGVGHKETSSSLLELAVSYKGLPSS